MTLGERLGGSPRLGYALSLAVNAALLWTINVSPGWQAMPFLTPAAADVLGLCNLTLLVAAASNAALLVLRSTLLRGLRDALIATFTLALLARLFVIFPFDLPGGSGVTIGVKAVLGALMVAAFVAVVSGWSLVARALIVLAGPGRADKDQGT